MVPLQVEVGWDWRLPRFSALLRADWPAAMPRTGKNNAGCDESWAFRMPSAARVAASPSRRVTNCRKSSGWCQVDGRGEAVAMIS